MRAEGWKCVSLMVVGCALVLRMGRRRWRSPSRPKVRWAVFQGMTKNAIEGSFHNFPIVNMEYSHKQIAILYTRLKEYHKAYVSLIHRHITEKNDLRHRIFPLLNSLVAMFQ